MNTISTGVLVDLLHDIAGDFGISQPNGWWYDLNAWVGERHPALMFEDDMPPTLDVSQASQAIAEIVAGTIKYGKADLVADARGEMLKDRGLIFEDYSTVLWLEVADGKPDTLVVWLGNLEDEDMTHIGRAQVKS